MMQQQQQEQEQEEEQEEEEEEEEEPQLTRLQARPNRETRWHHPGKGKAC